MENQPTTIIEHFTELRTRVIRSLIYVLIMFLICAPFSQDIYYFVSKPLLKFIPNHSMIATGIIAPFLTPFKFSVIVSLYIAIPFILKELWGFISPALYTHERKKLLPILILSTALFYIGAMFAYFVVMPLIFMFVSSTPSEHMVFMPDINAYLDFMLSLFFSFGIAFEIPVVVILLNLFNAISIEKLKEVRPFVIVGCFFVGMLLTPPDIFSQTLLAVPMCLLFEVGLIFAKLIQKT